MSQRLCTEPHCIFVSPHWHDENEDTHFLLSEIARQQVKEFERRETEAFLLGTYPKPLK